MKIRIIYRFLPLRWTGIAGITIYPFIFFKYKREDVSDRLFRHELEHVYQVREHGWFGFYLGYLWESIRNGYRNNKYELTAELMENVPLTDDERKLKDS